MDNRPKKEWPGDRHPSERDPSKAIDIEVKWEKKMTEMKHCGTLQMLYLLQRAIDNNRTMINRKNKSFQAEKREDRYIDHIPSAKVIDRFIIWHREDKEKNVFDGAKWATTGKYNMVEFIKDIGKVQLGPATNLYAELKKLQDDVKINHNAWATDKKRPKLQSHKFSKLLLEEKTL